jgi:hypothetical protein
MRSLPGLLLACVLASCSGRESVTVADCTLFDGKSFVKSVADSTKKSGLKVKKQITNSDSEYDTTVWASELNWEKELALISNISLCTPSNMGAFTQDTLTGDSSAYTVSFTPVSDKNTLKYLRVRYVADSKKILNIEACTSVNNILYSSSDSLFFAPYRYYRVVSVQQINFIKKSSKISTQMFFY